MKALLINPEKPRSFWTFREAMYLLRSKTMLPSLGLITMAALLPREWELRLVDLNCRELTEDDWNWADMAMLTGMIVQSESLLAVVREAGRRGVTSVVGGP